MKHFKLLSVLILIVSVLFLSAAESIRAQKTSPISPPAIAETSKGQSDNNHEIATNQPSPISPSVVAPMATPTAKPCQSAPNTDQDYPQKSWWWPPLPSSWVLILITAAYAVISFCTLGAISRQADLAETTLNDLERPWIIVTPKKYEVLPRAGTPNTPRTITFTWVVKNVGRSPAWLIGGRADIRKVRQTELPPIPVYPSPSDYTLTPKAPNELSEEFITMQFSAAEYRALWEGELDFILYGFVKYKSSLKRGGEISEHYTRYCFCVQKHQGSSGGLAMCFCGPTAYNDYT
jgi:hypothetical protein